MSVERTVHLSCSEIATLDSGLAWVVQQVDREFAHASMVRITVEQHMQDDGPGGTWRYTWTASVSGLVEERP